MRFDKIRRKVAAVLIMSMISAQIVSASTISENNMNSSGFSDSSGSFQEEGNTGGKEENSSSEGEITGGSQGGNDGKENQSGGTGLEDQDSGDAGENGDSEGEDTGGESVGSENDNKEETEGNGSENETEENLESAGSETGSVDETGDHAPEEEGTDSEIATETPDKDSENGSGDSGSQGEPDDSKENETKDPSKPDISEETQPEAVPENGDRDEQEDETVLSGRIIFMCDEGEINTDKIKFAVFKDGVLTMSTKIRYEKDIEDSEYADFTVWNYEVIGPSNSEEGDEYIYGLKDVNYRTNSDTEALFYISDSGEAEPMGKKPCEVMDTDFIYVSRSEIGGMYKVEGENKEYPKNEAVKMAISAVDEGDAIFLDRPDEARINRAAGTWSASELLSYNPETGQPIDWRVEIIENASDFEASYSNVEFFESEDDYAYNEGIIVNTFTGESLFNAAGRIRWQDDGNLYGKRPEDLSFIRVFTEDGQDVTEDVTIRATPSDASREKDDDEWNYEVEGLTRGTPYRVGQELKHYKSLPQSALISEPSDQGKRGTIELLTETVIDRSVKGQIKWKDSIKYGNRPDGLSFLKVLADGEDVTETVRITLTETYGRESDIWEYVISGMVEGVNYVIQAEAPEGYLADTVQVSVIGTEENRSARGLENSETSGDRSGLLSLADPITLTATKEVSGTITWNDNDDYWKLRPDKNEIGSLLGLQNSDIQIDVEEKGNLWKYSVKNLPFDLELQTAAPDGYQSAKKWSLFHRSSDRNNFIFKALTYQLNITNQSHGIKESSETYEFQYKVSTGEENKKLYEGQYAIGTNIETAKEGILRIPANQTAKLELPAGTNCQIEQVNQTDAFICFDSKIQNVTLASDHTAEFVNTLMTTYITVKNWNDNNHAERPVDEFMHSVKLHYAVGGGAFQEIREGNLTELGLEAVPEADFRDKDTNIIRLYYTKLPSTTRAGQNITYRIKELPMDGYVCTPYTITDESGQTIDGIMNTLESSFQGTKSWKDSGNRYHTRISREEWLSFITLKRTTETIGGGSFDQSSGEEFGIQTTDGHEAAYWNWISEETADDWTFTIDNLPQFNENGQEYTYWLEEADVPLDENPSYSSGVSQVHYEQAYENKGNYTNLTTACFNEGIMQNKLVGTTTYTATKVWLDELTGNDTKLRPDATLYLYRYPNIEGKNYKTATELQHTAFKTDTANWLTPEGDTTIHIEITQLAVGGTPTDLQAFDEDGNEFIYFIRESMQSSEYEQILNNVLEPAPEGAGSLLFHGGTLKNRKKGTASIDVTKTWIAAALQGMDASVTFTLEKRLKNSDDKQWETAAIQTLSGFTAEMMSKDLTFSTSRFDEYGREYEFRITESEITIDGKEATFGTDESGKPVFYAESISQKEDFYYFEISETGVKNQNGDKIVQLDEGGHGKVNVENKLAGKTKIGVKKRWEGGKPNRDYELSFHIIRDGVDICKELDGSLGADHKGVFKFTSKADKLTQDSTDSNVWYTELIDYPAAANEFLPKYDSQGKEYDYKVTEDPVSGYDPNPRYNYEKAHGHKAVVVTNYPPGVGKEIKVTKVWQDESDTIHRFPVKAQLYKSDGTKVPGKSVILTEGNDWTGWIGMGQNDNLEDYFVLESAVSRSGSESEWAEVTYAGGVKLDAADGDVETSKHYYTVKNQRISSSEYQITNTRYGFLDMSLEKMWIDGDSAEAVTEFRLVRKSPGNNLDYTMDYTLDGKADSAVQNNNGKEEIPWTLTIKNLDKYDETGCLYNYSIEEIKVSNQDISGGRFTLNGEPYSASVTLGEYKLGMDDMITHHKHDQASYHAVNQKSEAIASPVIHKIWKDDGPLESARPDIYLELWKEYKVLGETAPKREQVGGVNYHWNKVKEESKAGETETNHWIGIFESSLPRYTGEGYEITYYVREGVHVTSDYKVYYAQDAPKDNDWEMDSGQGEVPASEADPGTTPYEVSQGAPLGGTIINMPSAERTVSGKKIWQNMGVLRSEDYPNIDLKLYRLKEGYRLEDSGGNGEAWGAAVDTDGNEVEVFHLKSGKTSFEFTGLPKYDAKTGKMIVYAVREENTPMGFLAMDPEYNHDFHLVNTYRESTEYAVQLSKLWSVKEGELADGGKYPEAEVLLERVMKAPDGAGLLEYTRNSSYQKGIITKLNIPGNSQETYGVRFENLPKYAPNGLEYQYEVSEIQINGYNKVEKVSVDAFEDDKKETTVEITNTYDGNTSDNQFAEIKITKKWDDSGNFYQTRPSQDQLRFRVYRKAEGYTYASPDDPALGENITDWLKQSSLDQTDGDRWIYTFTPDSSKPGYGEKLRRYAANGKPYVYTIVEDTVDGYNGSEKISISKTAPLSGTVLEANLTNKLDTTSVAVLKTWADEGNVYLTRPDEIKVRVERSTDNGSTWLPYKIQDKAADENGIVTVKASDASGTNQNEWTRELNGLPKYDYSSNICINVQYRVREVFDSGDSIANYLIPDYMNTNGDGNSSGQTQITNTLIGSGGEVTSFSARKKWDDNDNIDNLRPENITFILVRDGIELPGKTVVLDGVTDANAIAGDGRESAPWEVRWDNLPKLKADGSGDSLYTVREVPKEGETANNPLPGYTTAASVTDDGVYMVTNTHTPIKDITLNVEKKWDDSNDSWRLRPSEITVELYQWYEGIPGNVPELCQKGGTGYKITLNTDNSWKGSFKDLPYMYRNGDTGKGTPIYYSVRETAVDSSGKPFLGSYSLNCSWTGGKVPDGDNSEKGYTLPDVLKKNPVMSVTMTNSLQEVSCSTQKIWVDHENAYGIRPDNATVGLYRRQKGISEKAAWEPVQKSDGLQNHVVTVTLNAEGNWAYEFSGLPAKDKDGSEFEYGVFELDSSGNKLETGTENGNYMVAYQFSDNEFQTMITNTAKEAGSVLVEKLWEDGGNQDGIRPAALTVHLQSSTDNDTYHDFSKGSIIELNAANGWKHQWDALPEKNAEGKPYTYRIVEDWPEDQEANPWAALYTAGDSREDGIKVVPVDLASASEDEKTAAFAAFTNSYTPRKLAVTASKKWKGDEEHRDIARPEELTLTLYQQIEGGIAEKYTPSSGSDNQNPVILSKPSNGSGAWTDQAVWLDLPVSIWDSENKCSRKITYWIVETPTQGYQMSQSVVSEKLFGCTAKQDGDLYKVTGKTGVENGSPVPESQTAEVEITNTLNAVDKKVVKLWEKDGLWKDSARPDEVKVQLYRSYEENGVSKKEAVGAPVTLSESSSDAPWTHVWKNLPNYHWAENPGGDGEKSEVPVTYVAEEAGMVPGYTSATEITSELSGSETIEVFQITNTMNAASVDIEKTWEDSDNFYQTRPETITVKLQRSADEGNQKNWQDVLRPSGVTEGIQLDGGVWGQKLTKEKTGAEYDGSIWAWENVFTGLPTCDKNGNAYYYRAVEVDAGGNGYIQSGGTPSWSADGMGKKFSQKIINRLDTTVVNGTKTWIDESNFFHTRPDAIKLTLKGSTESGQEWTQNTEAGQPVWTKHEDSWQYGYEGIPKYLVTTENGIIRKEEIRWAVEEAVPAGYTLAQNGYSLTNTLNTLGDWTITKIWNDENDKYHVRPASISFNVWADGVKLNPQPEVHRDGWTYTVKGLPAVYPEGHAKEGQNINYEIQEDETDFYTTNAVTSLEATYFTNTLLQGGLSVSKQRVNGADEEFHFKVTLTGPDNLETAQKLQVYTGNYKVFHGLDANVTTAAPSAERATTADGIITIRADEKFLLTGLPAGFTYQVEEIGADGYEVTVDHGTGAIIKDVISEASFTNTASGKLKITNMTENPGTAVSGAGSITAGGRVTVITENSSNPDKTDTDPYKPDKTTVSWKPETYWMAGGSLTVRYTDYGTDQEKAVTVKDYCDGNGKLKPLTDSCYQELLKQFPEAKIIQAPNGTITLVLADKADKMPRQTSVEIEFIPTIKGHLLTGTETGSVYEPNISGSVGEEGNIRYNGSQVAGTAENGYTAEIDKLLVGGPGLSKSVTITAAEDGTFKEDIEVDIYGISTKVPVSGMVVYTSFGSRITSVEIAMDSVPVPLDLGIGFKRKLSGGGNGGSTTRPDTKPGTGDTNLTGPGVETEPETDPAFPVSPGNPPAPSEPSALLNQPDPNPAQPLGPTVIKPEKQGRPPIKMEKNLEGVIDITVPGDDVSELEVKDRGGHMVYSGPVEDGSLHLDLEPGFYTLTIIDENGVPLSNFLFQIDDNGVPLGLPKTGDTGTSPYAPLTIFIAIIFIGIIALRHKRELEEEDAKVR